uniref:5-hydroxytryptamine receptor-like n=1 Tax=Dermatophagoides pteronyssinus TaxID=6956 RepID=A0A6P6XXI6_DERPT
FLIYFLPLPLYTLIIGLSTLVIIIIIIIIIELITHGFEYTGVFVICWLPFFINALLSPLSRSYQEFVPNFISDFFLWLGYINSCVNPIIYTIFSPDFRTAFKRMLLGKKRIRSNKAGWAGKVAKV